MNVATVQKQHGSDDCGGFAIAFALHAALGHCLEEIEFDQATMQDHLLKCYTTRNFTPFPTKKVKRAHHTLIMNIDVFCSCQMPDTYGDMVQCGLCEQWFHIVCWPPLSSIKCRRMELFTLYINLGVLMNFTFTE